MAESVYEELYNLAYGWISYMNREAVIAYDEEHLAAYKAGLEPVPYQDMATGMISEEVNGGGKGAQVYSVTGWRAGQPFTISNAAAEVVTLTTPDGFKFRADIVEVLTEFSRTA